MNARFDLSPLYRSNIGIDHLSNFLNRACTIGGSALSNFPPHNVEKIDENSYRITIAVAGFSAEELQVTTEQDSLLIAGSKKAEEKARSYLHQGIAQRSFKQVFHLTEHVKVSGANLADGLLHIDLEREIPEAKQARSIEINSA